MNYHDFDNCYDCLLKKKHFAQFMQFGTSCQNLYEQNTSSDYTTLLNKISLPEYHTFLEN